MIAAIKYINNRFAGTRRLLVLIAILLVTDMPWGYAACDSEIVNARQVSQRISNEWPLRPFLDDKTRYAQNIADSLAHTVRARMLASYFDWPLAPWRLTLIRDLSVNAYSIGNGQIYLTDGTFAFVKTEAELVAIIAHEMAHQLMGHFCQHGHSDRQFSIGSLVQVLDNNKEMEADALALQILKLANFPSQALYDMIKSLPVTLANSAHKLTRLKALARQLQGIQFSPFISSPEFERLKKAPL